MSDRIETPLTRLFDIEHPILLAPMDKVAGGRLAAAVTQAGGLGLLGGGYGEADWLRREVRAAGNQRVGVGFITWSLAKSPALFDLALSQEPAAAMFSFGDATPFVARAKQASVPSIWQIQRLTQAEQALVAGAEVIVVQGQEAGGHGMDRGLTALLPAVRDLAGPDQVLVAAGGIADGRGLAAALMLGADGVMLGTRFWASREASGPDSAKQRVVAAKGDGTRRSKVFDVARGLDWPWHYSGRILENDFLRRWHDDIPGLQRRAEEERARYEASDEEDFDTRVVIAGEAVDLIAGVKPAGEIVEDTVAEALSLLRGADRFVVPQIR